MAIERDDLCPDSTEVEKTILDGSPMQKMISQQLSFRATAHKPQAPPLADRNNHAKPQWQYQGRRSIDP